MAKRKRYSTRNKNKEIERRKKEVVISFYRSNPELFFERELGIKLKKYQKLLLKLIVKGGFNYV